jgi:hypothetical protein
MLNNYKYFIDTIGESIQISENQFLKLKGHYEALCNHINDNHILADEGGDIYQQGSFAIDTVIKPLRGEEFDVDIVAQFEVEWKPQHKVLDFYNKLFDAFKTKTYEDKLEEYRNNIRINYKSNYHFDIMPVVITQKKEVVKAPDVKLSKWVDRSPKSYAEWFNKRTQLIIRHGYVLNESAYFTKARDMDVDELNEPESYRMKAPLNRAVQLIKRARDSFFYDYEDNIPQSIVLTTLIALNYEGETDLTTFLKKISRVFKELAVADVVFEVNNPVGNINENFTEKWKAKSEYFENFKKFAYWFFYKMQNLESENKVVVRKTLYTLFRVDYSNLINTHNILESYNSFLMNKDEDLFKTEDLIEDKFELDLKYHVKIDCNVEQDGFRKQLLSKMKFLMKQKSLGFFISRTNVIGDYDCYWKVRNIGSVAERKKTIRGQINTKRSEYTKTEKSSFNGPHYVECYIVQDNKVVATDRISVHIA